MAYHLGSAAAGIQCLEFLIKVEPKIYHGNYYQSLAACYALKGDIAFAYESFNLALKPLWIDDELLMEYTQFLIIYRDALSGSNGLSVITPGELTRIVKDNLYRVLRNEEHSKCQYLAMEKNIVCPFLQSLILKNEDGVEINAKALAYYLLIKYPEFMGDLQAIDQLLEQCRGLCFAATDDISMLLWSDLNDNMLGSLMHIAYYKCDLEEISSLLAKGENINVQNNTGKTPIHCLLERDDVSIESKIAIIKKFFLLYDFSLTDNAGRSVIDVASEHSVEMLWHLMQDQAAPVENAQPVDMVGAAADYPVDETLSEPDLQLLGDQQQ
jgi:tetratricopeptide (TPR) repeat protein